MIPKRMHSYVRERLSDNTWDTRLRQVGAHCLLEFETTAVGWLACLGMV